MSTIKTFGAVDAAQPRAARALHGGGRRRVRRALRRPSPGLQPADRRRHRLRGLRLAVGRRLRHRLRQQGRADGADARRPRRARRRRGDHARDHAPDLVRHGRARRTERVDHPVLEKIRNADFAPQRKLAQLAESQLGTVGSGNHYVNLMEDEEGRIWVGVHFGSRGFGHKTASGFLALAQGLRVRRAGARGRDGLAAGAVRGRLRARRGVRRGDGARRRVRLRRPRRRRREGARDPRRRGDARGAQPPQLRVAGGALRPHVLGRSARAARRRGRARRASSAARWATSR